MDFDLLKKFLYAVEMAACITGFLHWNKLKQTHWKYFPIYLAAIVLFEKTGEYLIYLREDPLRVAMYNYVVIPMQILFFNWLFYKGLLHTRFEKLPAFSAAIYIICWLAEIFLLKYNALWVRSFSYTSGIILLLVLVLLFLYLLATGKNVLFLKNNMLFWVCLGFFVFYFCSLPFFGMGNYLYSKHKSFYLLYAQAIYFMNYIMYLLFTIAFIWGKPKLSPL